MILIWFRSKKRLWKLIDQLNHDLKEANEELESLRRFRRGENK